MINHLTCLLSTSHTSQTQTAPEPLSIGIYRSIFLFSLTALFTAQLMDASWDASIIFKVRVLPDKYTKVSSILDQPPQEVDFSISISMVQRNLPPDFIFIIKSTLDR